MVRHGRPPSRNVAGCRQPLTNIPVPPARSGQATTTILQSLSLSSSPSIPESPIPTQPLHRHSPRSRDIADMGIVAPNIEPRDMRRASIRVMVTRDGSPVRVPRPPTPSQDVNPDLITRGPQPPWRDPPIRDRPGREIETYKSPTAAAANVIANAPTAVTVAPSVLILNVLPPAVVPSAVTLASNVRASNVPAPSNLQAPLTTTAPAPHLPPPPRPTNRDRNTPPPQATAAQAQARPAPQPIVTQAQPAPQPRGRPGRTRRKRDARGRFVRARQGTGGATRVGGGRCGSRSGRGSRRGLGRQNYIKYDCSGAEAECAVEGQERLRSDNLSH